MKTLKESLLDDEDTLINDRDTILGLNGVREYLKNPKITLYPNIILDFVLYTNPGLVYISGGTDIFIKQFLNIVGNYPGWKETANWMLKTYFKYQKSKSSDSIFTAVSLYDNENGEGAKNIDPKFTNKILKNNKKILTNYILNLDAPNPITEFKKDIDEFIMFDQGRHWDMYFFFWIPKNALPEEKEVLELIFKAGLRAIKK